MTTRRLIWSLALGFAAAGCSVMPELEDPADRMNQVAESYVKLVLALGVHDADYVDAYYGPEDWRTAAKTERRPLAQVQADAETLITDLGKLNVPRTGLSGQRYDYLTRQLQALHARTQQLQGQRFTFDEEARALYDITPPAYPEAGFEQPLRRIAQLLPPGEGALADRYNAYLERFAIPPDRIHAVMDLAIAEARARTRRHLPLPAGERFDLHLVQGRAWSAYNWYQGGYHSRIEVNTELPLTAIRAIDLAVHEGYPGHHVYNALLEERLVRGQGWPEYQVYALRSPQSLIAEGTADYAVELAFPEADRKLFLREVVFPAAGLDKAQADNYFELTQAADALAPAAIEAARRYLASASKEQNVAFLRQYALASEARARQRLAYFDQLGAYIVNYSLGEQLVRDYLQRQTAELKGEDLAKRRWQVFGELLSSPRLPSGLAAPR